MRRFSIRRTGLFPRLALLVALGFGVLFAVMGILGQRALDASTRRILEERLVLTEMAASEIEARIQQAFHELLRASAFASFNPAAQDLSEEYHLLAHSYARIGAITLGVYFLDTQGNVILAEPPEAASSDTALQAIRRSTMHAGGELVSQPFVEPRTGHPAVAVTVAVDNGDGQALSYLAGLIDLSRPEIMGPLERALGLGRTGHAELITSEGNVIVSTYPSPFLHPGEHQQFYRSVLAPTGSPTIKTVPYESDGMATSSNHIMAVVPLPLAGWGLALGGEEGETLAPVRSLRLNLLLAGLVMLAATLVVTLWGTRRLIRPVQTLTTSARAMADGDLSTPVVIPLSSGEIGVLGEAFNDLRRRLLEARDRLTLWNLELEETVRRRSQEVAELRAEVELERLKAEFVSEVSHEFRTPLGLIKGYVTTLQRNDISPDDATRREFLTVIREEAEKLESLVEDLLDTSRLRAGTFAINREKVDLEALVQRVVERARLQAIRHRVVRVANAPLPITRADARRLEQVFDNLFDNALKYSPGGDIAVTGSTEDRSVHFCVSDQGEGIAAEELERVFDPFYRGSGLASKGSKGSGLGLTICRGIVQAHGGRMWAESAPGKGAAFHFTIPLNGETGG